VKHTPGPWTARRMHTGGFDILDERGRDVVTVYGGGVETESREANARLIAAAPDLLEACQEFLPILERQLASVNPGGIADGSVAVQTATARIERLRASITRATGDRPEKGGAL